MQQLGLIAYLQPKVLVIDCLALDIDIDDGHFGFYKLLDNQAKGGSRKHNLLYSDLLMGF